MVEMVAAVQRAHRKFGTSSESIGWLRFLIGRLSGKRSKAGPKPAKDIWNEAQSRAAVEKLFEGRRKKVAVLFRKYSEKGASDRTRERLGKSILEKYPESKEAIGVVMDLNKERLLNEPVSLPDPRPDVDDDIFRDPFAK